jgi:hypothetical protein
MVDDFNMLPILSRYQPRVCELASIQPPSFLSASLKELGVSQYTSNRRFFNRRCFALQMNRRVARIRIYIYMCYRSEIAQKPLTVLYEGLCCGQLEF